MAVDPNTTLIQFLEMLDTELAKQMLLDLRNEDKRSPQLYNSIGKLLERHKFQIGKLTPDTDILGGLSDSLDAYNKQVGKNGLTDDDEYTIQ
ncbi:DNA maturase A [Pectobacterium phage phiPccP-1]|uniref:DNA maturase A n=1 Tax=Pectobacterium phage DU_PP_II TaxID=2041489 RepID=A0A2D2W5X1_9CAUD|nr:terminase small subunit [Pectobacterium phage DU_PP_II]ATS93706.1 DNA maturase A [Pectobacterium phage DU_PP_II]QPI17223.1 DNA maturase A [Pectobacterium phage phiPccP-1]